MLPSVDYSAIEIVQAPGLVTVRSEAIHEARVIPIGEVAHLPPSMRSYMGDSRGYWEGRTAGCPGARRSNPARRPRSTNAATPPAALQVGKRQARPRVYNCGPPARPSRPST
jgi:hypothetical protein